MTISTFFASCLLASCGGGSSDGVAVAPSANQVAVAIASTPTSAPPLGLNYEPPVAAAVTSNSGASEAAATLVAGGLAANGTVQGIGKAATAQSGALFTDTVFASTSFWYQPIPANAPLHADSARFTQDFVRQRNSYYNTVAINTVNYASPVYVANAATKKINVSFYDCQHKGYFDSGLKAQFTGVPMPDNAAPADGTDKEMTIYDPVTDSVWEFWQMQKTGDTYAACWGGSIKNAKSSPGIFSNPYGTTATGLPFLGGQVTAEELTRGEIRHAIGISLVDLAKWTTISWPANRGDGAGSGIILEGSRFRIDPTIDIDALKIHPIAKTIAKAGQKYGFVVWDQAGAVSIRFQNPKSYATDPYPALFNGTPAYAILNGVPWNRLQFMVKDYGKP